MGGEWWFRRVSKDEDGREITDPFPVKEYQAALLEIRKAYRNKMIVVEGYGSDESVTEHWWGSNEVDKEKPSDNIFAKFAYKCNRHYWHGTNVGLVSEMFSKGESTAFWTLYWDPSIMTTEVRWSDVHARCGPCVFKKNSIEIQKGLARKFPKHFQLYLGDDFSGYGEGCHQTWGSGSSREN